MAQLRDACAPAEVAEPEKCIEDVDVSTLDERFVLPHMYPPTERRIWFPMMEPYS